MEEGSVLTSNVPDVRIDDLQTFVAPDVRYDDQIKDFQVYRTEVIRKTGKLREWTESLVSTIVFVLIFTTFVAQATQVPTPSMVPTIMVGDHFFLDKIAFPGNFPVAVRGWLPQRNIDRGDIIAFKPPPEANMTTPFVKRVIAIPGDTLEVKGRDVYLNGELIDEPYKIHVAQASLGSCDHCGPLTVPEGKFFVMGDNRDNSNDSRYWGFVDRESVIGKPLFVYWSFDSLAPYDSTERSWSSIAKGYISVAQHFFTRTRWFRFGTMVR